MKCNLCPRNCNADRNMNVGVCGTCGIVVSRVAKHAWEEPCISGIQGSGTVFFAGCNLRCRFCQNYDITVRPHGVSVSANRLADVFLYLQDIGAANVNLVTPSHVSQDVARALELAKPRLRVPVVYNTSSYEKVSALKTLDGLVDVYLPDLKFCSRQVSAQMCNAPDYFDVATSAIAEMRRQQPKDEFDSDGMIKRGLIIRHLVLPSFVEDSKRVLDWISAFGKSTFVSLMSQYFAARLDNVFPQLNRPLFKHEYQSVVQYFFNLGLTNGFTQDMQSATKDYVPEFSEADIAAVMQDVPHVFR
ncbi:MAG: radical SAM protein [Corallococcus sp.]|nr:radical SAM protein [Corallococcus sp.]MCM1359346.1 radical SAM protein [Corallococcus sp.]MCM1394789.1 radical SAM protein [Corallococcus sp.]